MKRTSERLPFLPYALALLFGYVGIQKMINMADFSQDVAKLWIIPYWIRSYLPLIVPIVEIWIAGMIFLPATRKIAIGLSSGLFTLFLCYHVWNLTYGLTESCHCFGTNLFPGVSKNVASVLMIALNAAAIFLTLRWLYQNRRKESYENENFNCVYAR